uniref:NADH dehydrogenase [ubiquinone] 1 alpha subcomplex assembly factor 3 n=1 Tax=Poecilia mexicana TaxID=48701 RepID=A0A3B3YTB6_9TELE
VVAGVNNFSISTIGNVLFLGVCIYFLLLHNWNISTGINCKASLADILVLGTGSKVERINPSVLALLKRKRIALEVQDTPNACATFNFLNSERRLVAAGLIPPSYNKMPTSLGVFRVSFS